MPKHEWLTETETNAAGTTVAEAKLKKMVAQTTADMKLKQADLQLQLQVGAAKAKVEENIRKNKEKAEKEAQVAKQKEQGSSKPLTENLGDPQMNPRNPGAALQGSTSDLAGLLPPAGEAPPFLMDQSRQVTVGPEQIGKFRKAPVRRTTTRSNVSPNVLTAAQAQADRLARVESIREQARWKAEQETKSTDKLFTNIAGADQKTFDTVIEARPEWAGRLIIERSNIEAKRDLDGTVDVMMLNPKSGKVEAMTIRRSELPEGGYPTFIKPTDSTSVTVNMPPNLTKKVAGIIEEDMLGNYLQLDRFNRISNAFNPAYLSTFKVKQIEATGFLERKLGRFPHGMPGTATQEEVFEFRQFKTTVDFDMNLYIKNITGAQMSIQERQFLKESRPNMDMSPTEFVAAYNAVVPMVSASLARQHLIRNDGFGDKMLQDAIKTAEADTEKLFSIITFDVVRDKMVDRMDHHKQRIIDSQAGRELSDEQIDQLAKSRVAEEFGMEGIGRGVQ